MASKPTFRPSYPWGPGASYATAPYQYGWRRLAGSEGMGNNNGAGSYVPEQNLNKDDTIGQGVFARPDKPQGRGEGQFYEEYSMPGYMQRESWELPTPGPRNVVTGRPTTIVGSMGDVVQPSTARMMALDIVERLKTIPAWKREDFLKKTLNKLSPGTFGRFRRFYHSLLASGIDRQRALLTSLEKNISQTLGSRPLEAIPDWAEWLKVGGALASVALLALILYKKRAV